MLKEFAEKNPVYIVTGYTDMRKGIDGLAVMIKSKYNFDPYSRALFLFCGRRCDRIKGLLWEDDGFILLVKRLSDGRFRWPRNEEEVKMLTGQQIRWLLEGLEINQPKAIKKGHKATLY